MAVLWYYLFAFGEEGRERRFGNVNWAEKGKERILERVEEYSTLCVCVFGVAWTNFTWGVFGYR